MAGAGWMRPLWEKGGGGVEIRSAHLLTRPRSHGLLTIFCQTKDLELELLELTSHHLIIAILNLWIFTTLTQVTWPFGSGFPLLQEMSTREHPCAVQADPDLLASMSHYHVKGTKPQNSPSVFSLCYQGSSNQTNLLRNGSELFTVMVRASWAIGEDTGFVLPSWSILVGSWFLKASSCSQKQKHVSDAINPCCNLMGWLHTATWVLRCPTQHFQPKSHFPQIEAFSRILIGYSFQMPGQTHI